MSICFFIGHRDTPADVYSQIVAEVERPILCGVTEFVVGHYGAFDRMAARAVREAKRQYPEIRLILLPYYETSTSKYGTDFDGIIFPEGQETIPKRAAIIRANQYMIDHCDFLIMYARHEPYTSIPTAHPHQISPTHVGMNRRIGELARN